MACVISLTSNATNCPEPNEVVNGNAVPPADNGNNGQDEAGQEQEQAAQAQAQPQAGPSGDAPNPATYNSKQKKSNKCQQEREDFQHQLLASLANDNPDDEQDLTELAMLAMVKKMKRNLDDDAQDELIDEIQQVVSRFIRHVKRRREPTAAAGSAEQMMAPNQNFQLPLGQDEMPPPLGAVGNGLLELQPINFGDM